MMNVSQQSPTRTRIFSRVIGPYIVIACAAAVAQTSDMQALVTELKESALLTWISGVMALLFGLIVVAAHQYWSGPAPIVVSVLGWVAVLKGTFLVAFPAVFVSIADNMVNAPALWVSYCVVFGIVGLYLTYVGWGRDETS